MKAIALVSWIGRFAFLGVFYFFLYHVYRSIVLAGEPLKNGARLVMLDVINDTGRTYDLWLEEDSGKRRTIDKAITIPMDSKLTMGRAEGNRLRTNDPHVSQRHFVISRDLTGFLLQDLNSTNGTYVDGVKVIGTIQLSSGCEIVAGLWRFRFEVT